MKPSKRSYAVIRIRLANLGSEFRGYDAELFGHWWFEGIWWIGRLVRMFAQDDEIEMTSCREYFQNNGMPTNL